MSICLGVPVPYARFLEATVHKYAHKDVWADFLLIPRMHPNPGVQALIPSFPSMTRVLLSPDGHQGWAAQAPQLDPVLFRAYGVPMTISLAAVTLLPAWLASM
jgi:hypothetical protein